MTAIALLVVSLGALTLFVIRDVKEYAAFKLLDDTRYRQRTYRR